MDLKGTHAERLKLQADRELWTAVHRTWNNHELWKRRMFGASPVADRIVQLFRTRRTTKLYTEREQYWDAALQVLTKEDWEHLAVQAHLLDVMTSNLHGVRAGYDYALGCVIRHVIDETADGFALEAELMLYLRDIRPRFRWEFTTQVQDKGWGVDILGWGAGSRPEKAVSVKPVSYAVGYYTNRKIHGNRHKEHLHHEQLERTFPGISIAMWHKEAGEWRVTPADGMRCFVCEQVSVAA